MRLFKSYKPSRGLRTRRDGHDEATRCGSVRRVPSDQLTSTAGCQSPQISQANGGEIALRLFAGRFLSNRVGAKERRWYQTSGFLDAKRVAKGNGLPAASPARAGKTDIETGACPRLVPTSTAPRG